MFELLFSQKTILQQRVRRLLLIPHTPDITITLKKTNDIYGNENIFNSLDNEIRQILSGHFSLETRLSDRLLAIPKNNKVQSLISQIFPEQNLCVHLPPTARFVLPGNEFAGVPNHQDISYNQHMKDFVVMWVPFVRIDKDCGGVLVCHGSGRLEEQIKTYEKKFWLKGIDAEGYKEVHCEMEPGDVLLLNKHIIHRSMLNKSNQVRYSVDYRFFGDRTVSTKHYFDLAKSKVVPPTSLSRAE